MKKYLLIIALAAFASCGGRGQSNADSAQSRQVEEYFETVTKYSNTYDADGRLTMVVERDYIVSGGLEKLSNGSRPSEYDYRTLTDGATERRKYGLNDDGRHLKEITVPPPPHRIIL